MNATTPITTGGEGQISFTPQCAPNEFFLAIYALLIPTQLILSVTSLRFYGYAIGMLGGLILELVGYIAKVQLCHNHDAKGSYIGYIIGLTLGPTFLSASLYLSIGSLQRHYDIKVFSFIGPQLFATIFIIGDFLCLCFIGCGGSLAAIYANEPIGVDLMIAGLGLQVLTTTIFCLFLAKAVHTLRSRVFGSTRRWFIIGVSIAAFCLLVRSCWRVAELSDGFNGPLASKENIFIGLDSIPVVIMSVLLTLLHPRFWFREPSTKREGLILLDCRRN